MPEFTRVYSVQGMDSNASPRFQMVPSGGVRYVIFRDGEGAVVKSLDPATCILTEVKQSLLPSGDRAPVQKGDRFFRIDGCARGSALVMAIGGSSIFPTFLEVGVKDKRKQLVMFHLVRDNAGHCTRRPSAIVGEWMPTLNYIWKRQANVEFVRHGVKWVTIKQNLGKTVTLPQGSLGTTGQTIAAAGDPAVDINVFFVWDLQESGNPADVDAVTTIATAGSGSPGTCIFEDKGGKGESLSFAHEMGHHLGLRHPGHRRIDLMWDFSGQRGLNLTRADVNTANP